MLRRVAVVALVVLAAACGDDRPTDPRVDAHAALCEAAARPADARSLFFDRSHDALHTVARDLEEVDRAQVAELLQAKERVESGLDAPAPSLPDDLARLADVYRAALGRLAIEAPPCEK